MHEWAWFAKSTFIWIRKHLANVQIPQTILFRLCMELDCVLVQFHFERVGTRTSNLPCQNGVNLCSCSPCKPTKHSPACDFVLNHNKVPGIVTLDTHVTMTNLIAIGIKQAIRFVCSAVMASFAGCCDAVWWTFGSLGNHHKQNMDMGTELWRRGLKGTTSMTTYWRLPSIKSRDRLKFGVMLSDGSS